MQSQQYNEKCFLLNTLICIFLTACSTKPFQPIPPKFMQWAKEGESIEKIKESLLACGYDNPYNGFSTIKNASINEIFKADLCMEKSGYKYLMQERSTVCDGQFAKTISACQ